MSKEEIQSKREEWEQNSLAKVLTRFPELKKEFRTLSNILVKRIYTPEDVGDIDFLSEISFPGTFPYTRGVQPTMYRGRLWTMRQYAGFATAEESNKRYKYLLAQGQTGLSIAFDLPTQIGYDSDNSIATGEVGKVGVSIDSLKDMEVLFDGIPLDKVSTSMTINAPAAVLLAMYIAVAEKQGVPPEKLRGTIQNDILKEYVARGTYIFPPKPSMRLITDIFAYCSKNLPLWNTISISGYHIREAGATAVQEIAFTIANGIEYVKAAIKIGLDVNDFASRLSFFFNSHNDLLEEVAKFRAARRLWAKIMSEFGATENSLLLRFHTQTAGCSLTAQQPYNNIIRVAFQALAAILGGTQSLHTNSLDEAYALPSEEAVQIALRTQQIIAHESGVVNTIDPLAGSYYIESLTRILEEQTLDYINKIKEIGGAMAAIEQGYMQKEIADSAYKYQREIENQERIIVGQNQFMSSDETNNIPTLKLDPSIEKRQILKIQELKRSRDNGSVQEALAELKTAAQSTDNLLPVILKTVKVYATLGEICDVLREVFGEYKAPELS